MVRVRAGSWAMYCVYGLLCPTKIEKRGCVSVCGLVLSREELGKNKESSEEPLMYERVRKWTRARRSGFTCYRFSTSGPKYHYCECQRCEWNQPQRDGFEWLVKETCGFHVACPSRPPILPASFVALPLCPSSMLLFCD